MIITADDYGLNSIVNESINELILDGALDGASIIINDYIDDIIEQIKNNKLKYIGLHFNIFGDGNNYEEILEAYMNGKLNIDSIMELFEIQLTTLIMKLDKINRKLDYIDSHHNIMHRTFGEIDIIPLLKKVCKKHGLNSIIFRTKDNSIELINYSFSSNILFIYCHPTNFKSFENNDPHINKKYIMNRILDFIFLKNGGYSLLKNMKKTKKFKNKVRL